MEILSLRQWYSDHTTISELFIDQEPRFAFILEPTVRRDTDPRGIVAIPEGRYEVTMYDSPKNKTRVPILNNVPGRTYIEMHIGNFWNDTDGCLLVGMDRDTDCVLESKKAFSLVVPRIDTALNTGKVFITVRNGKAA